MRTPTTKRELLGRFLRLAEFGGNTPFVELYRAAGGADRDSAAFLHAAVSMGYCVLGDGGTVQLTGQGLRYSRQGFRR